MHSDSDSDACVCVCVCVIVSRLPEAASGLVAGGREEHVLKCSCLFLLKYIEYCAIIFCETVLVETDVSASEQHRVSFTSSSTHTQTHAYTHTHSHAHSHAHGTHTHTHTHTHLEKWEAPPSDVLQVLVRA